MAAQERGTEAVGVPFSASRSVEATRCHTHASASNRPILDNDRSPSLESRSFASLFGLRLYIAASSNTTRITFHDFPRARAREFLPIEEKEREEGWEAEREREKSKA